jgi:hypothetical protein
LVQKVIAFGDFLWLGYYENLLFWEEKVNQTCTNDLKNSASEHWCVMWLSANSKVSVFSFFLFCFIINLIRDWISLGYPWTFPIKSLHKCSIEHDISEQHLIRILEELFFKALVSSFQNPSYCTEASSSPW